MTSRQPFCGLAPGISQVEEFALARLDPSERAAVRHVNSLIEYTWARQGAAHEAIGGGTRDERTLEAAYGLFWRQGFLRVSMDEIAARAGLTKRALYQHFPQQGRPDRCGARPLERAGHRPAAQVFRRRRAAGDELIAVVSSAQLAASGRVKPADGRAAGSRAWWSSLPICAAIRRARSRGRHKAAGREAWLAEALVCRRRVASADASAAAS